jgi:uncharacterized protein YcbX
MSSLPPSHAQLRPFRGVAWAIYLFATVGFSSLVIYSVTTSVFQMSPDRPAPVTAKSIETCTSDLSALYKTLEAQRQQLSAPPASDADRRWLSFRIGWMVRLRELEAECALDESARAELKAAFTGLTHVMDLATIEATQLAGQLGPALDSFRSKLAGLPGAER